jgi:prepilin-type processing-associated H-X9-DG protein
MSFWKMAAAKHTNPACYMAVRRRGFLFPKQPGFSAGYTLVELLVMVAILGVLIAMVYPGASNALQSAKAAKCMGNMRSYGTAVLAFAADNNGLPEWGGSGDVPRPAFEGWVRPYLHQVQAKRLRCPLGPARKPQDLNNSFNYCGNASLCIAYPKIQAIPIPPSRVVLAFECFAPDDGGRSVHFNMTMWGIGESEAGDMTASAEDFSEVRNSSGKYPAQGHGPETSPGLNLFFLDGHVALVKPDTGKWSGAPGYDWKTGAGIFYDLGHFNAFKTRGGKLQ